MPDVSITLDAEDWKTLRCLLEVTNKSLVMSKFYTERLQHIEKSIEQGINEDDKAA